MSIAEKIKERIKDLEGQRLHHLPSQLPSDPRVREVFASNEVMEVVTPPWPENYVGQRQQSFRASLDAFTRGEELSVSEDPFRKSGTTFLARVHPVEREVWDIRSFEPKPGIRCFGRFGGYNRFIALTWDYRENFEGKEDWENEVEFFQKEWKKHFGEIPPYIGKGVHDLLSNYYIVST